MASRQEEKEKRRRERLAEEAKAKSAAARARRLQIVGGGVIAVAIVAVAVVLITSGGGGKGSETTDTKAASVPIPAQKITDLAAAAKAADCTLKTYPNYGRTHVTGTVNYKTNPPTSGNHNPIPAEDGIYDPGNTPAKENFTHSLEHGRIEIQYRPGTSAKVRDQLETLFSEKVKGSAGYHTLLFENNTNMPFAIAATAWTHLLGCPKMNDQVFDAIRTFRSAYTDKGPEFIP